MLVWDWLSGMKNLSAHLVRKEIESVEEAKPGLGKVTLVRPWQGSLEDWHLHACGFGGAWGRVSNCIAGSSPWDERWRHPPTSHPQSNYTRLSGNRQGKVESTTSEVLEIILSMCYAKNFVHSTTLDNVINGVHCPFCLCLPTQIGAVLGIQAERWEPSAGRFLLLCSVPEPRIKGVVLVSPPRLLAPTALLCVTLGIWWRKSLIDSRDLPWATKSSFNIIIIWKTDWLNKKLVLTVRGGWQLLN